MENQKPVLELIAKYPDHWKLVLSTVEKTLKSHQPQTLGILRQKAFETTATPSKPSRAGATKHNSELITAKMTVYAIDQLSNALTGRTGKTTSLRDRLVFSSFLLPQLEKGFCLNQKQFDRMWRWFKDPIWASAELQSNGFWSVPTKEFLMRLQDQIQDRSTLELGSGRGLLLKGLLDLKVPVQGVDDQSWEGSKKTVKNLNHQHLLQIKAEDALKTSPPEVVISSWPPPGNSFEEKVFITPSVKLYIAINSKHRFASGNIDSYRKQTSFVCTSSEPFNKMLRPLELEQEVLIFRRK